MVRVVESARPFRLKALEAEAEGPRTNIIERSTPLEHVQPLGLFWPLALGPALRDLLFSWYQALPLIRVVRVKERAYAFRRSKCGVVEGSPFGVEKTFRPLGVFKTFWDAQRNVLDTSGRSGDVLHISGETSYCSLSLNLPQPRRRRQFLPDRRPRGIAR